MEIKYILPIIMFSLVSCASSAMDSSQLKDLYVDDFHSDDAAACKTSDVELNHAQAREFFKKAKEVTYTVIHDHYELAPCYIEGPLKYKGKQCSWKIRPGSTGSITCGKQTQYFVCDECDYLFAQPNK